MFRQLNSYQYVYQNNTIIKQLKMKKLSLIFVLLLTLAFGCKTNKSDNQNNTSDNTDIEVVNNNTSSEYSSPEEKMADFLSVFNEQVQSFTPFISETETNLDDFVKINDKFLDILTDTTNGFTDYGGIKQFHRDYRYVAQIQSNNDYYIIVTAEQFVDHTATAVEYYLYTISKDAQKISSVLLAVDKWSSDDCSNDICTSGYLLGQISSSTINTFNYLEETEEATNEIYTTEITERFYSIDNNGKIEESSSNSFENAISVNAEYLDDFSEYSIYGYFELSDDDAEAIQIALKYQSATDIKLNKTLAEIETDIVNNSSQATTFTFYLKPYLILEGEAMGEPYYQIAYVINDYSTFSTNAGTQEVYAFFKDFQYGDFAWYSFETVNGEDISFNEIIENTVGQSFEYYDDAHPYGTGNPDLIDLKFKIIYHSEIINNDYGGGTLEYRTIDRIEFFDM